MLNSEPELLDVSSSGYNRSIAVRYSPGRSPGLVWLGGYRSDMLGTKAEAINDWAVANGHFCCRHDYSGHGESGGDFKQGTISRWTEESLAVFNRFCGKGKSILVGSSMGAWVALLMARKLEEAGQSGNLQALLLLAPAPDFTHELMLPGLSLDQKAQLEMNGFLEEPSEYSVVPNIFTQELFLDGEKNRVMTGLISIDCPVHIIQGMEDPDVPYEHALKLVSFLPDERVTMTTVKDGDHRLSRPQDIDLLIRTVENLVSQGKG